MNPMEQSKPESENTTHRRFVSLKSLAVILDTTRVSARRWMREAGIHPVVIGRGRNGAIRYRWRDVEDWVGSRKEVK
jgi:hypothetical protein